MTGQREWVSDLVVKLSDIHDWEVWMVGWLGCKVEWHTWMGSVNGWVTCLYSWVTYMTGQRGHPTIHASQSYMSLNFTTRSPNLSSCPVMYVTQLYNQVTQPFTLPSHVCHSTLQPGHPTINAAQSCMSLDFTTRWPGCKVEWHTWRGSLNGWVISL
jgi:hypothetical protein